MDRAGDAELVGRVIAGKYQIDSFLGGGAMGAVYKAHQRALDKAVAIKVMHKEHARDPQFAARFQREAKAASRLDHPNAMRVFDFGEEPDGLLYIAMELLDGRDLFRVIQEDWPISDERIVSLLGQALGALAVAHDQGVVHRDLKPENIMVLRGTDDEGRVGDVVKVCDFGIAKLIDARSSEGPSAPSGKATAKLTAHGLVIGTPEYMSPEQGRGESLDLRSDLYSMGVILYQLLTGRVPFDAETALGLVLKHVTDPPPPPRDIFPGVNPRLEAACLKVLAKRREERFQSAREMRAALREACGGSVGKLHPEGVRVVPEGSSSSRQMADSAFVSAATASVPSPAAALPQVGAMPPATTAGFSADPPGKRRVAGSLAIAGAVLTLGAAAAGGLWLRTRPDAQVVAPAPVVARPAAVPSPVAVAATPKPSLEPDPPAAPSIRGSAATRNEAPKGNPPARRGGKDAGLLPTSVPGGDSTPAVASSSPVLMPVPSAAPPPSRPDVAPSPVVSAAPAPSVASAPASPAPVAFDPGHAEVKIVRATATSGVSIGKLRASLARLQPAWNVCYRTVLRLRGAPASGEATLNLSIDVTGRVVKATLTGLSALPEISPCVEVSARGVRVPDVDTGDATAEITLAFSP